MAGLPHRSGLFPFLLVLMMLLAVLKFETLWLSSSLRSRLLRMFTPLFLSIDGSMGGPVFLSALPRVLVLVMLSATLILEGSLYAEMFRLISLRPRRLLVLWMLLAVLSDVRLSSSSWVLLGVDSSVFRFRRRGDLVGSCARAAKPALPELLRLGFRRFSCFEDDVPLPFVESSLPEAFERLGVVGVE